MKTSIQTSTFASLGKRQVQDTENFYPIYYKATGIGNWYIQDLEYYKQPSFQPELLPEKLQLEYCFKAKIISNYLLTFQNEQGIMKALTGIRETIFPDWYYGDMRSFIDGQTKLNLILIQFSPDRTVFRLYLFENYYPEGKKKISEIHKIIRELLIRNQ